MANPAQSELWLELLAQVDTHGVEKIKMMFNEQNEGGVHELFWLHRIEVVDGEINVFVDSE